MGLPYLSIAATSGVERKNELFNEFGNRKRYAINGIKKANVTIISVFIIILTSGFLSERTSAENIKIKKYIPPLI
jgi:hypothetical protein